MNFDPNRPRRSILYLPGANARALEKARELPADAVMIDLEDAVAPDQKAMARDQVAAAVTRGGYEPREVIIRINGMDTGWGSEDLAMVSSVRPDGILVPKVNTPDEIGSLAAIGLPIWTMIETPRAIFNIEAIASAPGIVALVVGTNDLGKDMEAEMTPDRAAFQTALSMTVMAARANRIVAIDGVFNAIGDDAGLASECAQGRAFGFDGKTLIHPSQIAVCNRIFAPSEAAVAAAEAIIDAFELPENSGAGVITVDGNMTERLHLESARALVAKARAIEVLG
jgi:citrate lyase beta subunit